MFYRLLSAAASLLLLSSCGKEDVKAGAVEEDCSVTRSAINGDVIPGQYIVVYNDGATRSLSPAAAEVQAEGMMRRHGLDDAALEAVIPGTDAGFVAQLSAVEAAELKSDPAVSAVEPDRIVALGTCFTVVAPTLITWNVSQVGYGDGRGKTAWIIDSGIDLDHPDLNVDVARSRSFLTNNTSPDDSNGHGTHVAGIIGAKNNSFGTLGVASDANLVALRVLDKEGKGTVSSILRALSYISSAAKPGDVVNMSLGEEGVSQVLDDAVTHIAAKGIFISMAAGNDKKAAIGYSPGRTNAPNLYTVSAVDSTGTFASFSNFGNDAIDYAAPGVRILSTFSNGRYARLSGTSMAAPHVAGLLLINGGKLNSTRTALNDPDGTPDAIASK